MYLIHLSLAFVYFIMILRSSVEFVVETTVEDSEDILPSSVDANLKEGIFANEFPNFTQIPLGVRFSCRDREPGFYANPQTNCQVYHHCLPDGRMYTFLCGVGTIFNQRAFTCDHWYNYNCFDAEFDYKFNTNFYHNALNDANNLESVAPSTHNDQV